MAASKIKALQMWCRKMTEGYRDVDVRDFTVSWRDGLAFCAIIHHFRPDLIDYDSLSKENVFDNNHLAFTVGERELDIPAFLDAEDMVRLKTPDKLSIITYVSQYYNKLSQLPQLGGPGVKGKITATTGIKRHQASTPSSEPESKKVTPAKDASSTDVSRPKIRTLGDKCAICSNKVYLLERHIEDGKLYHRSCFRHSDLSPANKVYTRSPFLSPSLHGADNPDIRGTETSLSHKPTDLSKTFTVDEKTVAINQANRMIEPSSLFSYSRKNSAGDNSLKEDGNKNKGEKFGVPLTNTRAKDNSQDQKISSSATSLASESVENNKPSSTSLLNAMSCEKPSSDTWFGDKDFKKTETKRSLPLIFHQDHNVDDKNSDKSKSAVFTVSKSTRSPNASHDEIKTPVLPENKSAQSAIHDKTSPEFSPSGKSVLPVPKPRQNKNVLDERKEESMDTSEINFSPKPSPRFKRATTTTIHEVATSQQNAPTSEKKEQLQLKFIPEASNSESSSTLSSPQPLSASAPPPLPASAPPPLPASAPPPLPASSPLTPLHSPHDLSAPAKESFAMPMPSEVSLFSSTDHLTIITTSGSLVLNSGSSSLHSSMYSPSSTENISSSSSTSSITLALPSVTKPASTMSAVLFTAHREERVDLKVSVSQNSAQQTVVHLVKPSNTDKQEQEMRSGLLKSLAAVRKTPVVSEVHGASSNTVHVPAPNKTLNAPDRSLAVPKKSFISNKLDKFQSKDVQHKTKSESELSYKTNRSNLANSKNLALLGVADKGKDVEAKGFNMNHGKTREYNPSSPVAPGVKGSTELETKPFGTTYIREQAKSTAGILPLSSSLQLLPKNITQEEPSCLREKLAHTKTNGDKTERPKSTGNTLNANGDAIKLDWQKEAERRKAALRGNFVDPEVKKLPSNSDRYVQRETKLDDVKKVPSESKREVSLGVPMSLKPVETARTVPIMPVEKSTSDALVSHHSKSERSSKDEKQSKNEEKKNLSSSDKVDTLHRGEPLILPPSKPERSWAIKDRMSQEPDHKHMLNIAQMNKGGNAHEAKEQKSVVEDIRKKIAVETPQPLLPPPRQQKKKILVDEPFEFPVSPVQKALPENFKHTPPPRPPPPKKTELSPANLSAIELQQQLREIDKKLNQLELQGRHLEDSIRSVETAEDEDELMMEWFKLITNKNDLVRQENDLVYMSRELDLEDEQDQIENQLRYLLNKEAHEKSMEEKTEEEYLIQRKIDIVNKRNDIVDSMDEDRLRYEEEDRDIAKILESKDFSKISEGQLALAKPEKQLAKSTFYT